MEMTFDNLLAHINTVYVLVTNSSPTKTSTWMPDEYEGHEISDNLRLKVIHLKSVRISKLTTKPV